MEKKVGTNLREVYLASDSMVTSLGFSSQENFSSLASHTSGIATCEDPSIYPIAFPASRVSDQELNQRFAGFRVSEPFTRLEKMIWVALQDALQHSSVSPDDPNTVIILSTTKGNIDLLKDSGQDGSIPDKRQYLHELGRFIQRQTGNPNKVVVISNACISGVMALLAGKYYLDRGKYQHAIVIGADLVTEFVVSGFQSFKAISPRSCRPYDTSRDGINLGEGCAVMILTTQEEKLNNPGKKIRIVAGATSNDANHISGPSRTGAGLLIAIQKTMQAAKLEGIHSIDHICAHGTATVFNDEMESKAFQSAGLADVPLNSLKGFFGHTLGAAGVMESLMLSYSMRNDTMIGTHGFETLGVSQPINVLPGPRQKELTHCLKTASGFGGCNAAILLSSK